MQREDRRDGGPYPPAIQNFLDDVLEDTRTVPDFRLNFSWCLLTDDVVTPLRVVASHSCSVASEAASVLERLTTLQIRIALLDLVFDAPDIRDRGYVSGREQDSKRSTPDEAANSYGVVGHKHNATTLIGDARTELAIGIPRIYAQR